MTAVFVTNYEMMVGAMMEINDLGIRVPDELSVIGFDNVDFARASVPKAEHRHSAYGKYRAGRCGDPDRASGRPAA